MKPSFLGFNRSALALAVALGLAGCATVKRARDAQKSDAVPAGERTLRAAEVGLTSNRTLALDEALKLAQTYRSDVSAARQDVVAARAALRQTSAGSKPSVDGSAGYSTSTANSDAKPRSNDRGDRYSADLNLRLLLYDFGKTPAQVRQARADLVGAQERLRSAQNDAAFEVRTAFFNRTKSGQLVQVAEEAVRLNRERLDQAKAYAEVGRRTQYDVTKAEVDLGNSSLDLVAARGGLADARASLNKSLGLAEDPGFAIRDEPAMEISIRVEDFAATMRKLHPDLLNLRARELAASAAVDEAVADLYPELALSARYGWSGGVFPLIWNWSAGVNAAASLFSGGRKTAAIDASVARLRIARANAASREQQLFLELSKAVSQLDSARERRSLTDLLVRQAGDNLALVQERYRVGRASSLELTDAQVALTQARAKAVQALADYQTALAQIRHATGEESW